MGPVVLASGDLDYSTWGHVAPDGLTTVLQELQQLLFQTTQATFKSCKSNVFSVKDNGLSVHFICMDKLVQNPNSKYAP